MTVIAGSVGVEVVADTSKLDAGFDRARAASQKLDQQLGQTAKQSMANVTASTQRASQAFTQITAQTQGVTRGFNSVSEATRSMTEGLVGANVAAIAVGTAIGGVVAQAVMTLIRGTIDATTQFAALHNELTLVAGIGVNAAQSMEVIGDVAQTSSSSIRDLQQRYAALVQSFQGSRATLEQVNESFRRQEEALSAVRQNTVGGAMQKFLDSTGQAVIEFDKLFGVSNLIVGALTGASFVMQRIADLARFLQGVNATPISARVQVLRTEEELTRELAQVNADLATIDRNRNSLGGIRGLNLRSESQLLADQAELQRRITLARADAALATERARPIHDRISEELQHQIGLMRATQVQQEIQNRLLQTELQFRQAGLNVDQARAAAQGLAGQITAAAYAQQFQSLRDSLMTQESLEMQSFQRRTEMIGQFLANRLISQEEHDSMMEAEFFRSNAAMTQIQMSNQALQLNAMYAAGQEFVSLLQAAGQKSKALAIAAIALNTALRVAQTIQNTAAAAAAAMAQLGPIAGPPAAAAITAWGAAQVAAIIAAGALQGYGALKQGGPSLGGGGGGGGSTPSAPGDTSGPLPRTLIIEPVDPAAIFTGQQLNDLMDAISENAKNGHVLVASRLT